MHPGNPGGDGLEGGANVVRNGVGFLWIPQIQMTGTALQVDHDNRFRLAPTRSAGKSTAGGGRLGPENRVEGHSQHAGAPHAEKIAAAAVEVGIAEVLSFGSW